jgi:glutamine amidotransferase
MNNNTVVIVDYGVGNLYSVKRALEVCGANDIRISCNPTEIKSARRVVLPGVGAFADGIKGLQERGLDHALREFAETGRPLLGICLGMQLLATYSNEFGVHLGLNLIPGKVIPIPVIDTEGLPLKAPYIGWSTLVNPYQSQWGKSMLAGLTNNQFVYLVHSFQFKPDHQDDILATFQYGGHEITAAVKRGSITGVQFHPEKSGKVGLSIISEFLRR